MKFRKTRKQRGGMGLNKLELLLSKDSIIKNLGLCSSYVTDGQYGTILKSCFLTDSDCKPPCFSMKYVPSKTNNASSKINKDVLAHESFMLYLLTSSLKHANDNELKYHIEQYIASITTTLVSPWLFMEHIAGVTLTAPEVSSESIQGQLRELYFETIFILDSISKILQGFVHGDLNPGNIFIIPRSTGHRTCSYERKINRNNNDPLIEDIKFTGPNMIKLIDFGFSECNSFKWEEHPGHPRNSTGSIAGIWQLDAYMALDSFYHVSNDQNKVLFKNICTDFFGATLAEALDKPDFDIYENISLLESTPSKSVLLSMFS